MPPIDTIHTYAKINLILQVAPPITDPADPNCGMHPICSWMHAIDLSDQITIEQAQGNQSTFDIHWAADWKSGRRPVDWETESDLIVRAHALLEIEAGRPLPVSITASKSIPAGGGLGGGSSNAAGVLMGLNDLFELGYDEPQLQSISLKLGSDIPFFLDLESHSAGISPRPAVVSGFGDQVQRTPRFHDSVTLLIPKFGCNTGAVYEAFDAMESVRAYLDQERVFRAAFSTEIDISEIINDLTLPAMADQPELEYIFQELNEIQIDARLTGSGSTMFFLLRDRSETKLREWLRIAVSHNLTTRPTKLC